MCAGSLAELDSVGVDMGNSSNKCQGRGISQGRDSDSLKVAVCLGSYHRPIYRSVVATLLASQSSLRASNEIGAKMFIFPYPFPVLYDHFMCLVRQYVYQREYIYSL